MKHLLESLAHAVELTPEPHAIREAVLHAEREIPGALSDVWLPRLQRAGESLGVQIRPLRLTIRELARGDAERDLPLITLQDGSGRRATWLMLRAVRHGKLQVADSNDPAHARWVDAEALGARIAVGLDEPVTLAQAAPLTPLAPLGGVALPGGAAHGVSPWRRLLAILRVERQTLWAAVSYAVGIGVLSLAIPVAVQALVTSVAFGTVLQPLVVLSLMLLAGLSFAALLRALQYVAVEVLQQRLFVRAALDLAWRFTHLAPSVRAGHHAPELANRFFDVISLQKGAAMLVVDGVLIAMTSVLGMVMLAFYHPLLLAFDLVLLLGLVAVLWGLGRGATDKSIKESKAKYAVAAWLQELARHPTLFSAREQLAYGVMRSEDLTQQYITARQKHFRAVFQQWMGGAVLSVLASVGLLSVGGWLVIHKQLTLGQLVAAELIVSALTANLLKLGKYLETVYDVLTSADKIGHLVDLDLERNGGHALAVSGPLPLSIHGARVEAHGRVILDDVNLEVRAGDRVVLHGPAGSGKSTLLRLLHGSAAPTRGRVELGGVDLRMLQLDEARSHVTLLSGVELFEGTIEENLALGRVDISPVAMRDALEQVGLWEQVAALPAGLRTRVVPSGAPLSASAALKLMVARAILLRPRLLLVDLPLQSLAPEDRATILSVLTAPDAPWTLLLTGVDGEALPSVRQLTITADGSLAGVAA